MKIMAPAGGPEAMQAAIRAGADEVYMGIAGFGARRFARNFSLDEYCKAVSEAHRMATHVNVTLNTILSDEEIDGLRGTLRTLYEAGVDAVIVQDLGFADFLRRMFPDWPIHASTQLSIASPAEAQWAEKQGFSRLVLARELSFDEIAAVRRATSVELEVFASGALCIACSGKCLLSSFIGGRSGNRGMCTQPCRQEYKRLDGQKTTGRERGFLLSSCDQWQEETELRRFAQIGVDVIKLEGRMKSPEYVFETVRFYRETLDRMTQPEKTAMSPVPNWDSVVRLFNRGYAKGYVYEHDPDFLNPAYSASWGVPLGVVKRGEIHLSEAVRHGDGIVYLDRFLQKIDGQNVSAIYRCENGEAVSQAEAGDVVQLDGRIPSNAAVVYKTFDIALNRQIESALRNARRRNPVAARLTAKVGQSLRLVLRRNEIEAVAESAEPLGVSQKTSSSRESLIAALDRLGQTPFRLDVNAVEVDLDADVFVPTSVLNAVRRQAVEELDRRLEASFRRTAPPYYIAEETPERNEERQSDSPRITAAVRTLAQAQACREAGLQTIYRIGPPVCFAENQWENEDFSFARLACSLNDAATWTEAGAEFALDWTFHLGNRRSLAFCRRVFEAKTFFLSPELSAKRVATLCQEPGWKGMLGLVVYGHLSGMYTRKTLFSEPFVPLENQDGRSVFVLRNSTGENRGETTGSRVFYGQAMDLTAEWETLQTLGLGELRFDFTCETPNDVRRVLRRAFDPLSRPEAVVSYGWSKGIF